MDPVSRHDFYTVLYLLLCYVRDDQEASKQTSKKERKNEITSLVSLDRTLSYWEILSSYGL